MLKRNGPGCTAATSTGADERARERATLFAFGLPLRRVVALDTAEGVLIGSLGTAVGVGLGLVVVQRVVTSTMRTTMPELGLDVAVSGATVATAVALGCWRWPSPRCSRFAGCVAWTSPARCASSSSRRSGLRPGGGHGRRVATAHAAVVTGRPSGGWGPSAVVRGRRAEYA